MKDHGVQVKNSLPGEEYFILKRIYSLKGIQMGLRWREIKL